MRGGGIALSIALAWSGGCHRAPPVTVEPVRIYVAPGLPGELAAEMARGFRIADPRLVASIEEAELAWLRSPSDALALGARAVPDSAPEQPRVPGEFLDPQRRFAPLGAVATVIVTSARHPEPFAPISLSQLADPRLRGRVALARLGRGDGPRVVAALELAFGERGTHGWLTQLVGNAPILVDEDREVVALVASGRAVAGLVDSLTAAGAAEREGLRIVFPDQKGSGAVVIPTALVVLPGASSAARKLSAWLTGPNAEEVIAQRAPGLLPLREGAAAPEGIIPVWKLGHVSLKWNALAEREAVWRRRLEGWPTRGALGR
jgi:iron(III) transport system substrate-binding protein